jgi:hypothetical protein
VQSHKPIGRKRILEESPKFMKKMRKLWGQSHGGLQNIFEIRIKRSGTV